MREQGYYWVKVESEWWIAKYDALNGVWYLPTDGGSLTDESELSEIDERPIVRNEPVPSCKSALKDMEALYESVSALHYLEIIDKYHFELSNGAKGIAQAEVKAAMGRDNICETYRGVKVDLIHSDGYEVRLTRKSKDELIKAYQRNFAIEHQDLLRRYIDHVRQCEGVDFIDRCNSRMDSDIEFTELEVQALTELARE